jgi:hypothetical protein
MSPVRTNGGPWGPAVCDREKPEPARGGCPGMEGRVYWMFRPVRGALKALGVDA